MANGAPLCPIPLGATVTQKIKREGGRNRERNCAMPRALPPWKCIWREAGRTSSRSNLERCVWARTGLPEAALMTEAPARGIGTRTSEFHTYQSKEGLCWDTGPAETDGWTFLLLKWNSQHDQLHCIVQVSKPWNLIAWTVVFNSYLLKCHTAEERAGRLLSGGLGPDFSLHK